MGNMQWRRRNWFATDGAIEPDTWLHVCQTVDGSEAIAYVARDGKKPEIPASGQGNPKASSEPYELFPDRPLGTWCGSRVSVVMMETIHSLTASLTMFIIWDRALSEDEGH